MSLKSLNNLVVPACVTSHSMKFPDLEGVVRRRRLLLHKVSFVESQ